MPQVYCLLGELLVDCYPQKRTSKPWKRNSSPSNRSCCWWIFHSEIGGFSIRRWIYLFPSHSLQLESASLGFVGYLSMAFPRWQGLMRLDRIWRYDGHPATTPQSQRPQPPPQRAREEERSIVCYAYYFTYCICVMCKNTLDRFLDMNV